MKPLKEIAFTRKITKLMRDEGYLVYVISASSRQTIGLPDRYVMGPDVPGLWIEFKGPTTRLSMSQRLFLSKCAKWKHPAIVLYSPGIVHIYGSNGMPVYTMSVENCKSMREMFGKVYAYYDDSNPYFFQYSSK